jgi:hypothetical protein
MKVMQTGVPYTDAEVTNAKAIQFKKKIEDNLLILTL